MGMLDEEFPGFDLVSVVSIRLYIAPARTSLLPSIVSLARAGPAQ